MQVRHLYKPQIVADAEYVNGPRAFYQLTLSDGEVIGMSPEAFSSM